MNRLAVLIDRNGNQLCSRCGASDFFTVCEENAYGNPANMGNKKHPNGFCPFCGAEFTHRIEVDDLEPYEGWRDL